jgi:transcriptional regulator with XRE-family HTH domain
LLSNLSQKELAAKFGHTKNYFVEIEHGRSTPTLDGVVKISDYFDVSIDWLCGRTENKCSHLFIDGFVFGIPGEGKEFKGDKQKIEKIEEMIANSNSKGE